MNGVRLGKCRSNGDQSDAGLCGGRRTNEELSLRREANGADIDGRRQHFKLDKHNDCGCDRNGSRGVQDNAEGTMVGVGVDRVDVGHLDDRQESKKRQAHKHNDIGSGPCVSITAHPCVKSGQNFKNPRRGFYVKDTHN